MSSRNPWRKSGYWIATALLVWVSLCGCAPSNAPSSETDSGEANASTEKKYKIGFANLAETETFYIDVREGLEQAAEQAGNVELICLDNHADGAKALANADIFLAQQCDGVIEFNIDASFGPALMEKFEARGVPVIAIDIPMEGATFFGVDNFTAGKMAGERAGQYAQEHWGGEIDAVLSLENPQAGELPMQRMEGQIAGIRSVIDLPEEKIRRLDSKEQIDVARRVVTEALLTLPDAHRIVITSISDTPALGAVTALRMANRTGDAIVTSVDGCDARPELRREGSPLLGSVASFPERYGDKLIPAMIRLIEGEDVPAAIHTDHIFLDSENLDHYYPDRLP
jgi:ribose transport system substrate-binding protein